MKAASRCSGVLLLLLVATASLRLDAAQETGFHEVPIPGGIAALAPLGLPAEIERGMILPELARTLYDPAERRDAQLVEVISFFSLIEEFNNTWLARVPADGVSREMTSTRQGRDRVNAVFEQLGLRLRQRQREYAAENADGRTAIARRDVMARAGIEQGGATLDLDHVRRLAVTLREMASELRPAKPSPLYTDRLPAMRRQIDRAISELAKLTRPRDLQRLPRIAAPLLETADVLTADVIGSVAYAPHLGDAAGVVMLGEDMSRWHDFGVEAPIQEVRRRAAWQLPQEASGSAGVPRHLKGAMLGIDLGLARVQLQRLSTDLPERPTLSPNDMSAFAESVVLLAPDRTTDADRDEIRSALARGRARVTDALHDVDALELLAQDAGMGPWRRRALRWMVANEPDRVAEMFSLSEVFWLGEPRLTAADAWGASQASVSGCLCLRLPAPLPWESRAARLGAGLLGSHAPDVLLRTAELLAELQVPAMLIKPVMAYAAQALIDGARLWHGEDWRGLIRGAKELSRGQVEDFVAALVGRNLVVPAEGAPAPGR